MKEAVDAAVWERFARRLRFAKADLSQPDQYDRLREKADPSLCETVGYCAVAPALFGPICRGSRPRGSPRTGRGWCWRSPCGTDLASSRAINDAVGAVFPERQVYRIDHYLGKETVLNLLALRFANSLFTTNWDHTPSTTSRSRWRRRWGSRAVGYFDASGQLRDMVQNHLLQILTWSPSSRPPPSTATASATRSSRSSRRSAHHAGQRRGEDRAGQYAAGFVQGRQVPGYLGEEGCNPGSTTETFAAMRVDIDNWRWAGVPFYLRTGKRLAAKRSEVVVHFQEPAPQHLPGELPEATGKPADHPAPARRRGGDRDAEQGPGLGKGVRLQRSTLT